MNDKTSNESCDDIEIAKAALEGHTLALCLNGNVITSNKRGIAPMADFIREGKNLFGYSAADRVVGRAAAMLFISAGVRAVYAETVSVGAVELFESHKIAVSFAHKTERIINRDGTGQCPMELAVASIDDIEIGVKTLFRALDNMKKI